MPRARLDIRQIQQLPLTHATTIPEEYLDAMGHMNVMWYTHLFSMGMGGLLQTVGLSWDRLAEHDGGTFALEAHVRYLSEVRVGQEVDVHSRVLARSEKRYHVMFYMVNRTKQDIAATFEAVGAYVDLQVRRMAAMPPHVTHEFDQLIQAHSQLDWKPRLCGCMGA